MNKIICYIDKQENYSGELEEYIAKLDEAGYQIFLYLDVILQEGDPSDIMYNLDTIREENLKEDRYTFFSNMCNLTQYVYRVYHQIFDRFIYFYQDQAENYPFKGNLQVILDLRITDAEDFYKKIYTNTPQFIINNYICKIVELNSFIDHSMDDDNFSCIIEKVKKIYYIKDRYYFFEPLITEKYVVINKYISKSINNIWSNLPTIDNCKYPKFSLIKYAYSYNETTIAKLLTLTEHFNYQSMVETYELLETLEKEMEGYHTYVYNMTCCILDDISLSHTGKDILRALLLTSFLLQITKKPFYLNRFIEYAIESNVLSCENRFYLWNQAKRYMLTNRANSDTNTETLMKELYQKAYDEFKSQLVNELKLIPLEERNKDTIAIFTIQFLSERHAPTRTTLERCYTLSKLLGKNIILINTREQLTSRGMLPLYKSTLGNVMDEYSEINKYQYKDCEIPFYQPGDNMPSLEGIRNIITKIKKLKPQFIFSIGNGSIIADLCGNIVHEASIGVAFSTLPTTMATFSVIGKTLSELEWEYYLEKGYTRNNIIESTFTFELLPKKMIFNRKELGIPENDFVLITVGIRLDMEIDDTFMETILSTFKWGTHIVFAGYFEHYTLYCEKYPGLKEHSTFVGYCEDILALMEICNLYVNPKRLGGGFSIIEAFHEGKPGVTIDYGDIAIAAGKPFTVKNYDEMTEIIHRYITDKDFYQLMAERAIAREKVLTDSAAAMNEIIHKIQDNPLFF
ncbi:hypothetical protein QA584_24740 [Anaerocolumna sp. AGMB13025]|uniref:hypothetical protein n=1 Tax=Anaerocolumna sp. AGMB13025 TaxID=3039116 RepID=UPI00241EF639|nr:hypothetical protein [Anaerocolumna sp. AGMB13025]WFR56782.1 hypothetical protein QA584_24740 [Anaerocolumna sp. AGMB13025]